MRHPMPATKASKDPAHETPRAPSAGPRGIARRPPNYGIAFVDRATEGEGPLQLMPRPDRRRGGQAMVPVASRDRSLSAPNRTGLPDYLKAGIESLSDVDMSDVRVHYNSSHPAQLNALAYTQGTDIHLAPGQERHLPHEAWHVVQQKQGRVQPTFQLKGEQINDDRGLEHEAEVMGARALTPVAQVRGGSEVKCLASETGDTLLVDEDAQPAESVQLRTLSGVLAVQRKYELCPATDVQPIGCDHRAKTVRAKNIRGETLGAAANSPSVEPFGWSELKTAGHTLANTSGHNSHYNAVRAHLMNGRLGGPGDEKWNLAPAPAQVNSLMSAGPETAAKNLVDAGHTIWIETTVSYHGNSTTANDFTSVVPNHILMKWGTMDGNGPEKVPLKDWSTSIDLPVAPLQGHEAQEYKDWDSGKSAELVSKLSTQSNQVRAQAFDLVSHDNLKFEIIKAYPSVYLSMERRTKGQVLGRLNVTSRTEFLTVLGVVTSLDRLVEEAILPLAVAGYPLDAQQLFANVNESGQRVMLISWKRELLDHLGAIGNTWSKRDYTIFKYNGDITRAALIQSMSRAELTEFLRIRTKPERIQILDNWAGYTFLAMTDRAKNKCVSESTTINDDYKKEYATASGARDRAAEYRANHPSRRR